MQTVKHYFSVYKKFFSTCLAETTTYRLNFFLLIIMDIFFYASTLATVSFIYDHVATIGPWQKEELMFFISFVLAVDQLHMSLISESFWVLSFEIRTGALDYILMRPLHEIFSIFFRHIRISSLLNIFVVWSLLIYFGNQIDLHPMAWVFLPFLVLFSLTFLTTLEICLSTSMFWMTEGFGINFLRMQMQNLARWPHFIYGNYTRKFFMVFLPVLLIGSAPVQFLYDFSNYHYLLWMLVLQVIVIFFMRYLWRKALIRYDSASS